MTDTRRTWSEAESARYRAAGYWEGVTFGARLRAGAARHGERVALVDGDRRWTYAQLDAEADRVAGGLRGLGVGRGDRVVVQLPNRAEFLLVWFGLQRLGAVPVHAMPGHRRREIGHLVRVSGAVACVVPDRHARFDHRRLMREVRAEQGADGSLRHVVVVGDPGPDDGFVSFEALRTAPPLTSVPGSDDGGAHASDVALLLLSGGTTGLPKLIPRTHDDYAYNARACAEVCALDAGTVYLAVLPLGFNFAFACPGVLGTLTAGGTVVVAPDPSPQTAFALVERERVTLTSLTPPLVPHWTEEAAAGSWDLGSLAVVQVGGARLPEDHARKLGPALGVTVQQVFGMAEGLINLTRLDDSEDLICATQGGPSRRTTRCWWWTTTARRCRTARPANCSPGARTRCGATTAPRSTTARRSPRTASTGPGTWCGVCPPVTSWWWGGPRTRSTAAVRRSPRPRWRSSC